MDNVANPIAPGNCGKPDWDKWKLIPRPELWQAVALSCDIEPADVDRNAYQRPADLGPFYARLAIAVANAGESFGVQRAGTPHGRRLATHFAGTLLHPPHSTPDIAPAFHGVRMKDFVAWACEAGWPVPDALPRPIATAVAPPVAADSKADERSVGKRERRKFLKIIWALAKKQGIDLEHPTKAAQSIGHALQLIGEEFSLRTLQDVVNDARRAAEEED